MNSTELYIFSMNFVPTSRHKFLFPRNSWNFDIFVLKIFYEWLDKLYGAETSFQNRIVNRESIVKCCLWWCAFALCAFQFALKFSVAPTNSSKTFTFLCVRFHFQMTNLCRKKERNDKCSTVRECDGKTQCSVRCSSFFEFQQKFLMNIFGLFGWFGCVRSGAVHLNWIFRTKWFAIA